MAAVEEKIPAVLSLGGLGELAVLLRYLAEALFAAPSPVWVCEDEMDKGRKRGHKRYSP